MGFSGDPHEISFDVVMLILSVRLNVCQLLELARKRAAFSPPSLLYGPADSSFMLLALLVHKITRAGDTDASVCACARTVDASADLMYAGTPCYLSYPENSSPHCDCNRRLCRSARGLTGVRVIP